MIKDEARVGGSHNSASTELHSVAAWRVAGCSWPATVVGADSVSGPSGSWPSNSAMQERTLYPKSFSMGEQQSAFTSNSQLELPPEEASFGKKLSTAIQPVHVKELRWQKGCRPLRKSPSFHHGTKIFRHGTNIETDLPNPSFHSAPEKQRDS